MESELRSTLGRVRQGGRWLLANAQMSLILGVPATPRREVSHNCYSCFKNPLRCGSMISAVEGQEVILMGIYGHGWGMMVGMFLFWALVLGAGVWLLARLFPSARIPQSRDSDPYAASVDPAIQVVRHRYASGELSKSEYEEVLRTLERTTSTVGDSPQKI